MRGQKHEMRRIEDTKGETKGINRGDIKVLVSEVGLRNSIECNFETEIFSSLRLVTLLI